MIEVIRHQWEYNKPIRRPTNAPAAKIVFADPPYNLGKKYDDDPTADAREDYQEWVEWVVYYSSQMLLPGGTFWWVCPEAHGDFIGPLLTRLVGPRLHRVIWYESFAQYQGKKKLTEDYRFIFCHQKPGAIPTFNPDEILIPSDRQEIYKDKRANPDGRVPGQVWKVRRLQGSSNDHVDWHPCQLPPELLERVVKGWSSEGDTVMDAFAGSGNMGLICKANHRNAILVDQSPTYVAKMKERLGL